MELSRRARLCWTLHERRWMVGLVNVIAALLFVIGSAAFFQPSLSTLALGLFLAGSILFLLGSAADLFATYGPEL